MARSLVIRLCPLLCPLNLKNRSRCLADPMARAVGTPGRYMVMLDGAVYMVEVLIDGFATKQFADRWSQATDPAQKAVLFNSAEMAARVWASLFPSFAGVFVGLSFAVIGTAIIMGKNFPRWLGLWGVIGGAMCFLVGLGAGLDFEVPVPIWIAGVIMSGTWGIPVGVMMWRRISPTT